MKIVSILGQKKVAGGKKGGEITILGCMYCRQYSKHREGCPGIPVTQR